MNKPLHISDDLSFPIDFVTQTQAILAKKRVGKTYTAQVEAEELLKAGQQIAVIDPTGAWWGLKSSADGKHPGFSIAIFGGEHGDIPLEEGAGEVIANAIVDQRFSAILDLSLLRKGQINRFMAPFLETLYRRNRQAMHLFVDEADSIAPQRPFGEEARMLGALEDVVRRGGIRGIGTTLITQRPAVLNKNVLTQCEILCALRIVHHKDIDAIREWIEVHGDERVAEDMIKSLPALPVGTAWFWSPGWGDIFKKVKIRAKETFDSGATPKAGEIQKKPKAFAEVDIALLGEKIAATVQQAKENNPSELKRKISELEKKLAKGIPTATAPSRPNLDAEMRTLRAETKKQIDVAVHANKKLLREGTAFAKALVELAKKVSESFGAPPVEITLPERMAVETVPAGSDYKYSVSHVSSSGRVSVPSVAPTNGDGTLNGPQRKVLTALSQLRSIGKEQPSKETVAAWAGYSPSSGSYANLLGSLRTSGLVNYPTPGIAELTPEGLAIIGELEVPDQAEIRRKIDSVCSGPEQKVINVLFEHGKEEISKTEIAERTAYSENSGSFANILGGLRTKGFLDYPRPGVVKAADWLFW